MFQMKPTRIVFATLSLTFLLALGFAREESGRVVFRVVDASGKSVPYRMENCTDSKGKDCIGSFLGLEAAQLPFGRYSYTLGRSDVVTDYGKLRGEFRVYRPETWLTLEADPTLSIGPNGVAASDSALPRDFVIRGKITPMPVGKDSVWIRLQSPYKTRFAEARVDSSGDFRIHQYLLGPFTLSVVRNGEFLHVEAVVFQGSLKPDLLLIKLEDPPAVRVVP
jgi:hypothetical protein